MTRISPDTPQAPRPAAAETAAALPDAGLRAKGSMAGGAPDGPLQRLATLLDRLLVANVFLVLAGALWFGAAVVLHSQGVEAPLRIFQGLWQPLFTPAISVLMAAALLSGALGWWRRRGQR